MESCIVYKTYAIKGLTMGKVAITVTVVSEPPGQKAVFKGGTDGGNRDPAPPNGTAVAPPTA
jgi:hypothetical protein